jgi:hypothetical protein
MTSVRNAGMTRREADMTNWEKQENAKRNQKPIRKRLSATIQEVTYMLSLNLRC